MVSSSLQVRTDSSDWLEGIVHEEDSGEMLACPRSLMADRTLRPQHDQALKCPRCNSTHTKFCYYNNYSLSQPRYFCKTCRRYWTKGGSLRNVPVGGGCRKNKRSSNKKTASEQLLQLQQSISSFHNVTDLHHSFLGLPLPHLESLPETPRNINFMEFKCNPLMLESPVSVGLDLMPRGHVLMNGCDMGLGDANHGFSSTSPLGFTMEGRGRGSLMEACQRLALPFGRHDEDPMPSR